MKRISLCVLALAVLSGNGFAEDEMITIGSGNTVGIYYAASSAVAKLFNRNRQEYQQWVDTEDSEGSVVNINNVLQDKVDFGLASANVLHAAIEGTGPWEGQPQQGLQGVLKLYVEKYTIVAAVDADIHTLSDLKGKRINVGAAGSSTAANATTLLELEGLRMSELTLMEKPVSRSSDLLEEGEIDAYFFMVGHPAFSVKEAAAGKRPVRLVTLSQPLIDHVVKTYTYVTAEPIPIDYYPDLMNEGPVATIGAPTVLFTHEDMSEETVYRMVKAVMTNLDLFRRQHPAFRDLAAEEMAQTPVVPLHPGAERYFKEAGLLP